MVPHLHMPPRAKPDRANWHETEERFRLLVESVKDYGIFTLDADGCVTSWNEGARRIKGYEAAEILGSHFSRFYPPEDVLAGKPERELVIAIAEGRVEDEGWRLRKDGTRFWADVVITSLWDSATGELKGFGKVTRDLTERRQAEIALRQSEEQFRLLVDCVAEYAIFMLDPTGHVVTWNSGAEKAKGYLAKEIIGKHFGCFYTKEDRDTDLPNRLLEEARSHGHVRAQGTRVRKDGTTFQADVLITAIRDSTGQLQGFSKVTRDITEQLRIREMETAKLTAEKANEAKDNFLAVLSHELRTPLTPVIAGASYLIENRSAISDEEMLEHLHTIRRNAQLEAQLIDDLLDLTRISRGKMILHPEAVDIHAALRDVGAILQEEIQRKQLALSYDLQATGYWSWVDPTRIRQVFWNLINNAIKFTPEGGRIKVRSANPSPTCLRVDVSDSGLGIAPEQQQRIFGAFEQGEVDTTRKFGGLGLGLAITRHLVEQQNGSISVTSEGKGKGACFTVTLALLEKRAEAHPVPSSSPTPSGKTHRILLVDDNADTLRILSALLSKRGHEVKTALTAGAALEWLAREQFDVLVSDIGLPDRNGWELMREARARRSQIRGIALTGYALEADIRRCTEAGFEFHLAKPVDIDALQAMLHQI
nr:PAS domain S-box protein [Chthoniobacter flavus]